MTLLLLLLIGCVLAGHRILGEEPRIELQPSSPALVSDRITLRLTGLDPGELVTLTTEATIGGVIYGSSAVFVAGPSGTVDPATQAPIEGSYDGVDDLGLLWSTRMSIQVEQRLSDHEFPHAVEHAEFPDAGHSIARPTVVATARCVRNGGSAKANAHAGLEAWERTLEFLERSLAP